MQWKKTEWRGCHPPIDSGRLDQAEHILGVVLPRDYKECAQCCHGGRPSKNVFAFDDPEIGRMESCIGTLLSFAEDDNENVIRTHTRLAAFLPEGAVPVADDGGGDFVCLDYSGGPSPTIGYWHHGESKLIPLASSFSEFLDMLYEESSYLGPQPK